MSGQSVTLTDDIDLSKYLDANNKAVVVAADNITIDLSEHTLYSVQLGVVVTGANVTIKNGTIARPVEKDYSYGLVVKGANATIENVTIESGINVSGYDETDMVIGGTSATIKNCNFVLDASYTYYAVCAQGESNVTIEGGTITRTNAGKANNYFWIEKEFTDELGYVASSSMTVNGVHMTSTCGTTLYNTYGVAPNVIDCIY